MAIYDFGLLVNGAVSGVDVGIGRRYQYLKQLRQPVYNVFTELFREREVELYMRLGIPVESMYSAHLAMTDFYQHREKVTPESVVAKLSESYPGCEIRKEPGKMTIIVHEKRFACVLYNQEYQLVLAVLYYESERLISKDIYLGSYAYTNYYVTVKNVEGQDYAKLARSSFINSDGTKAFDILIDEKGEHYVFPNRVVCNHTKFLELVFQRLPFQENDIILIDRPGTLSFAQPLLKYHGQAEIMLFLHSGHFFYKNEDPTGMNLNSEYIYWFRNSHLIHRIIVSTNEQRNNLIKTLGNYGFQIPVVKVIPICGIDSVWLSKKRKPCSLIAVSRLVERKHIDWLVKATILAHQTNPRITLDIYGSGSEKYRSNLIKMVNNASAGDYIRFQGRRNLRYVYQKYECFISASVWETLGLSLMEAVSSGLAMIGLDVRYGNRLFIKNGDNGYLIPVNLNKIDESEYEDSIIQNFSERILEMFSDQKRLKQFQEASCRIAENYLDDRICEKKKKLILGC